MIEETPQSMDAMIASLPGQLRWALGVDVPAVTSNRVLACGMGGSGIAGDYVHRLASAFGSEVAVHKDYGIPPWAYRVRPLIVVTSYSGNTEEAVSSLVAAAEGGLDIVAVTTGGELARLAAAEGIPVVDLEAGYQPRAAFGMCFGALMKIVAEAGLIPDPGVEIEAAASILDESLENSGAVVSEIASHVGARRVGILTAEPLGAVAYRWKTQFNENADRYASASIVPELTHNELVPLAAGDAPALVALRSGVEAAAVRQRFKLMQEAVSEPILDVVARGATDVERMLHLTVIGDLVTVAVAKAAGVDPVAVDALERFKEKLRER
jgi:glucose/mannose-6-phosphate isomerase